MANDSTALRTQPTRTTEPARTTESGTAWLVVGGLFAAAALTMLIAMAVLPGGVTAVIAAVTVAVVYAGMVVVRVHHPPGARRLGMLAAGMLLIAAVSLGAVALVALTAWSAAGV